ncbi:MAG TPA: hypothetical protein VGE52_08990, partial [Pirellulales bacterium]
MNRAALVFIAAAVIVSSSGCCVLDRLFCGGCRPYLGCNRFQGCAEPPSNCGGCCGDGGCSSGGCGSGPMLGSRLFGGCGGGCASGDCGSGGCGPRFGGLFTSGCRSCGSGVSGRHYSAG